MGGGGGGAKRGRGSVHVGGCFFCVCVWGGGGGGSQKELCSFWRVLLVAFISSLSFYYGYPFDNTVVPLGPMASTLSTLNSPMSWIAQFKLPKEISMPLFSFAATTPWFDAYRDTYLEFPKQSEHETIKHYISGMLDTWWG